MAHDQIEAMTMAAKIVNLNGGHIQQSGILKDIYNEPANLFVAEFIGTPKMNILDDQWVKEEKALSGIPILSKSEEHDVMIGIRPEYIELENVHKIYQPTI